MENFDYKAFIERARERKKGHLSLDDIMAYLYYEEADPTLEPEAYQNVQTHLEKCSDCKRRTDNIARNDPFLVAGQKPPPGFFQQLWDEVVQIPPPIGKELEIHFETLSKRLREKVMTISAVFEGEMLEACRASAQLAGEATSITNLEDQLAETFAHHAASCIGDLDRAVSRYRLRASRLARSYLERGIQDLRLEELEEELDAKIFRHGLGGYVVTSPGYLGSIII